MSVGQHAVDRTRTHEATIQCPYECGGTWLTRRVHYDGGEEVESYLFCDECNREVLPEHLRL